MMFHGKFGIQKHAKCLHSRLFLLVSCVVAFLGLTQHVAVDYYFRPWVFVVCCEKERVTFVGGQEHVAIGCPWIEVILCELSENSGHVVGGVVTNNVNCKVIGKQCNANVVVIGLWKDML